MSKSSKILSQLGLFVLGLSLLFASSAALGKVGKGQQKLILAHNLDTQHPVHQGMLYFANEVKSQSKGRYSIQIYANGQLGREREVIELLQMGAVAMTKVSSLSLEAFVPEYSAINLPYIFRNKKHFFSVLDGPLGQKIHQLGVPKRFRGLSYYDGGARSFYTDRPILHPDDLQGLKIRVMGSQTAIEMMKLLGGSPTPMSYGEIYTALQQNVIDGAENNITALTLSRHGEVSKHYSLDEHIMAPDVLIISEAVWQGLSPEDQEIFKRAAEASARHQRELWQSMTKKMTSEAKEKLKVEFHFPPKEPFIEKVTPLHAKKAAEGSIYAEIISGIKAHNIKDSDL